MKHGNWVPIDARLAKYLPFDREYTELEAMYSLQLNYDKNNDVTVSGLAKSWGWSRKRTARFLKTSCVKIIYPKKSGSRWGKLVIDEGQVGLQVRDRLGTGEGQVRVIDNKHLGEERDRLGAGEGQVGDRLGSTINHTHTQNQEKNILSTTVDDAQGGLDGLGNDMPIVGDGGEYGDSHKDGHGSHGSSEGSRVTAGDSREIPGRSLIGDSRVRGEDQGAGNQPTEPLGGGRVDEPGNYATQGNNSGDVAEYCGSDGTYGECGNGEQPPQGEDGGAEFHPQRKNYKDGGAGESDQVFGATERNDCSGDCGGELKDGGPGGNGQFPLFDGHNGNVVSAFNGATDNDVGMEFGRIINKPENSVGHGKDKEGDGKSEKPKKPKLKLDLSGVNKDLLPTIEEFIEYRRIDKKKPLTQRALNGALSGFAKSAEICNIPVQWVVEYAMMREWLVARPEWVKKSIEDIRLQFVDNTKARKTKQHTIDCRSCFGYEECMYSDDNGRSECSLYSPKNGISQNILPFKSKASRTPRQTYMDDLAAGFDAIDKEESRGS